VALRLQDAKQHSFMSILAVFTLSLFFFCSFLTHLRSRKEKKKKKDSAGSDDTASMIKGGGYVGACTRQPPTAQTIKKKLVWVRGVVCRSTQTRSLTVVACVILQCIPCFYECRCMSDGVFIQFVCQFLNLMVVQIKVCQSLSV